MVESRWERRQYLFIFHCFQLSFFKLPHRTRYAGRTSGRGGGLSTPAVVAGMFASPVAPFPHNTPGAAPRKVSGIPLARGSRPSQGVAARPDRYCAGRCRSGARERLPATGGQSGMFAQAGAGALWRLETLVWITGLPAIMTPGSRMSYLKTQPGEPVYEEVNDVTHHPGQCRIFHSLAVNRYPAYRP